MLCVVHFDKNSHLWNKTKERKKHLKCFISLNFSDRHWRPNFFPSSAPKWLPIDFILIDKQLRMILSIVVLRKQQGNSLTLECGLNWIEFGFLRIRGEQEESFGLERLSESRYWKFRRKRVPSKSWIPSCFKENFHSRKGIRKLLF